ncbi:MAG TPA: hypothetical protein VMZ28_11150 [Kofleriaceae bacterium]|nr:hypothetical protein [Kofleriaceae bacterium]
MRAVILLLIAGCGTPAEEPMPRTPTPTPTSTSTSTPTSPPVLTDAAELDRHVGELVTLRGTLTRTKIPTILGVDVHGPASDALADRPAEATGTLEREVITQEALDAQIAEMGQFANRGAGTFYRLVRPGGGGLAVPHAPPP